MNAGELEPLDVGPPVVPAVIICGVALMLIGFGIAGEWSFIELAVPSGVTVLTVLTAATAHKGGRRAVPLATGYAVIVSALGALTSVLYGWTFLWVPCAWLIFWRARIGRREALRAAAAP